MNFAGQLRIKSIHSERKINAAIEKKIREEKERREKVKHEKFVFLTKKYHEVIMFGLDHAASRGKYEKYINFDREDFKANCPGLGNPREFQALWLSEMTNPESSYVPINPLTGEKRDFQGIKYDIWNNGAFTTVFTW